ncbi:MAG: acyltransferase family protein [Methanobacteriaceae archaeon]|jgi:fucose 4-O-acetylase-like acetyltransferase|nr:acyltransferase family protein [Candidatus Methanorudis spinitermitis]
MLNNFKNTLKNNILIRYLFLAKYLFSKYFYTIHKVNIKNNFFKFSFCFNRFNNNYIDFDIKNNTAIIEDLNKNNKSDDIVSKHKKKNKDATDNKESNKNVQRLFKYDNLKGLAIIFVVFVHLSFPFFGFSIYKDIGTLLAPIAMGIFVFVSGYFSKVDENTQIKAFKNIFIPYILFSTFWIIFIVLAFGNNLPKNPYLVPVRGLWYLLVLFWLRFSLPVLVKIKHIFWISLFGALAIGLINVPNNFLALTRTFCYLPLFLIGFYFKHHNEYLNSLNYRIKNLILKMRNFLINHKKLIFGILIIVLLSLFFIFSNFSFSMGFFGFKKSYVALGLSRKIGILMRLFGIVSTIFVIILINYLMPNKQSFLTKLGRSSLYIYVFHFYFTESMKKILKSDLGSPLFNDPILTAVYLITATALITFILSRDPIEKYIGKLLNLLTRVFVK